MKNSIAQSVVQFYPWFDFYFHLNQNSLKGNIIKKMTFIPRKHFTTTTILHYHKATANDKKITSQNKSIVQIYCSFYHNKNVNLEDSYNKIGIVKAVLKGKL